MADLHHALTKLENLAWLAASAESELDKAGLFGAVMALHNIVLREIETQQLDLAEHLDYVCRSVCAVLGYEPDQGHGKEKHLVWALGWISVMRHTLGDARHDA